MAPAVVLSKGAGQDSPGIHALAAGPGVRDYASLASIDERTAARIVERNLTPDRLNEFTLAHLVRAGILTARQKDELALTLDLGKLTGDNLPFVSLLKNRGLKSVRDLIPWDKQRWQTLITQERVLLPPGETPESYANHIFVNLEGTFPSQFLLHAVTGDRQTARLGLLDSLKRLPFKNNRMIEGTNPARIDWDKVDPAQREPWKLPCAISPCSLTSIGIWAFRN